MAPNHSCSLEKKRMQDDQDVVREFLVESHENLSRLDQDLIELELRPKDAALLASVFRTIHTIKGTCGFFAFSTLEKITHQAETLLSQLRDGKRELDPSLVSLILETVDATRKVLAAIEASGKEGPDLYEDLTERLRVEAQCLDGTESGSGSREVHDAAKEPHKSGRTPECPESAKVEDDVARSSAVVDANIRVGVVHLDKLMDLVGELVLTRNQILQFNAEREDPALNATSQRLNLITTELQEGVMKTRMQPIGMVWNKLPRVVRDMAVALGKQIRLEMDGADTELDRTIIEAIKDPLVHLVRNSCDHGIEPPDVRTSAGKAPQGKLTLRAYHEGGQVNIEIGDDGTGINVAQVKQKAVEKGLLRPEQAEKLSDREALNLIFLPGFSTAQTVTKVSGRGVGMDVVKSNIEKIGGVVDISNRPGEGSTVKLKIPLTLAIIPGLVITSGGERFVIPQVSLLELIRLEGDSSEKHIEQVHGTPVYRRRGSLLPIAYLNRGSGARVRGEVRGRQHCGSAGRRPTVWAGGRRHQRYPGDRGQAAGQAIEGAHGVRGRDHHGRRPSGPHPRRAGHWPAFRSSGRKPGAGACGRGKEGADGPRTAAPAAVPRRLIRAPRRAALAGREARGVSLELHRVRRRMPGGPVPQPHPAPGTPARRPGIRGARSGAGGRSGAGDRLQRRRPQRGNGGRSDSGCR